MEAVLLSEETVTQRVRGHAGTDGSTREARAPAAPTGPLPLGSSYGPKERHGFYRHRVVCVREDDIGRTFTYTDKPGCQDGPVPPPQTGTRVTKRLSRRAARMIRGACVKAAQEGHGLRSFWTATFGPEARAAIECGALIPGREVHRLLDGLRQWAKRNGRPVPVFVWVAENPYDDNPHVHLLTDLRIPYAEFQAFSRYLEQLWGHGWVHMEPIKHPYGAGKYILKAVNYVSKDAETADQGRVYGNRYGISQRIRVHETTCILDGTEAEARVLDALTKLTVLDENVGRFGDGSLVSEHGVWRPDGGLEAAMKGVQALTGWVGVRGLDTLSDKPREWSRIVALPKPYRR